MFINLIAPFNRVSIAHKAIFTSRVIQPFEHTSFLNLKIYIFSIKAH